MVGVKSRFHSLTLEGRGSECNCLLSPIMLRYPLTMDFQDASECSKVRHILDAQPFVARRLRVLILVAVVALPTITDGEFATMRPVVLPMTMEKNLPLVQISVNDTPDLTFILDSAASGCLIAKDRAEALGLKPAADGITSGSGGFQHVGIVRGLRLKLGEVQLAPTDCYTFDMSQWRFHTRVDGVLGSPLFRKYVVEIDYPGLRVRIFHSRRYRPSAKAERLPMRVTVGPIVRGSIRVRGKAPIELDMQLDTGSAHILTLCTPTVDRLRLLESADELTAGTTHGVGESSSDMTGRIEEVRLGRLVAENPVVRFSRQTNGALGSEQYYSGNIGGDFLRRYKVTFDFSGSRVFLE